MCSSQFCYSSYLCALFVLVLLPISIILPFTGVIFLPLLFLYVAFYIMKSICAVEVHPADKAAWLLYEKRHGKTPDLPDKLRGVFWFATNAAPELLTTFEGEYFDPHRRMLNMDSGGIYNWSYSTGFAGVMYWAMLRMSYIFCSELHVKFDDDELTFAQMPLYVCGCCHDSCSCDGCWMPMGMWWSMKQIDDDTWDRQIYLYCMPWQKWKQGSYVLRRIIDHDGNRLPAFDDMMASIREGEKIKGINKKPLMQIMNGDDWTGNVLFGSAGNPEGYDKLNDRV